MRRLRSEADPLDEKSELLQFGFDDFGPVFLPAVIFLLDPVQNEFQRNGFAFGQPHVAWKIGLEICRTQNVPQTLPGKYQVSLFDVTIG